MRSEDLIKKIAQLQQELSNLRDEINTDLKVKNELEIKVGKLTETLNKVSPEILSNLDDIIAKAEKYDKFKLLMEK